MNADTVNKREDFIFIFFKRWYYQTYWYVVCCNFISTIKKGESKIHAGATCMTSCLFKTVIVETDYPQH